MTSQSQTFFPFLGNDMISNKNTPCEDCLCFPACLGSYKSKALKVGKTKSLYKLMNTCPSLRQHMNRKLYSRLKVEGMTLKITNTEFYLASKTVFLLTPFEIGVRVEIGYTYTSL